ncbi:hypothetical protein DB30_05255 [Enhygromyxa salina]|uniref:Uncharacterized protein n=1 Tax=Enhygromyxa salina TaxID=215803 RepID=A0A0C2D730_9BACT|nr:hypothetical protein [Enhygromyxa salina]KIG15837.1 hypothetical protein DB30_05255 [Enhygromyxa salina]
MALAGEACEHMFLLMQREFGRALVPPEDVPRLVRDCVVEFEAECAVDPVAFEREARCIARARNLDELELCGGP